MYVDQFGISAQGGNPPYGCRISQGRIIALSIVSMGIYWMYRTWAQYRDHMAGSPDQAGQIHYPVWHGLTQLVPVYGFFRFHAHVRSYKELMQERGVTDTLNVGVLVTVVVINAVVSLVAGAIRSDSDGSAATTIAGIGYLITLITVLVSLAVICKVQSNLNNYWDDIGGAPGLDARFGKGEVICLFIGILLWVGVIADFIW